MITVTVYGEAIPCSKAVKGPDYIRLYDGENPIILFSGIRDFSGFTIEGGDWSAPETPSGSDDIWDALAEAITEGVDEYE